MYSEYEIQNVPLTLKSSRQGVERFLDRNGLRLDDVDTYAVVTRIDGDEILAGGGLQGNVIKCLAVDETLRGTGMMQRLISHLLSIVHDRGHNCVRVFTKPENRDIFESLSFTTLATSARAIFMEHGMPGIGAYTAYLRSLRREGTSGLIVMNANPFTLGHRALVEWAAQQVDTLYVMVVREDVSQFRYADRLAMVRSGCRDITNVVVVEGSDYAISATTFPSYFIKERTAVTDAQIALDLDLCANHLMPALGATVRLVGDEPLDALTARYVELMQTILPAHGLEVKVMPRLRHGDSVVSASLVRKHLADGHLAQAAQLVPQSTVPSLIAQLATRALIIELDTTPKPGLVDKVDNGAHCDMDYGIMAQSIAALQPIFTQLAHLPQAPASAIVELGKQGEQVMLQATGGVNTHRGALFSLGLAVVAATRCTVLDATSLQRHIADVAQDIPGTHGTHGAAAVAQHKVAGALAMAQGGYKMLFDSWLPCYDALAGDPWQAHKTLMHIMGTLDDTNVIHRVGYDRAQEVKAEAKALLSDFTEQGLRTLNATYIEHNISPGGAADMLSLTILIHSLLH